MGITEAQEAEKPRDCDLHGSEKQSQSHLEMAASHYLQSEERHA